MGCTQLCINDKNLDFVLTKDKQLQEKPKEDIHTPSTNQASLVRLEAHLPVHTGLLGDSYSLGRSFSPFSARTFRCVQLDTNYHRAVKFLKPDPKTIEDADLLFSVHSPYIVKLCEIIESESSLCLITELCTGGDIFERILSYQFISENIIASFLVHVLTALEHSHAVGYYFGHISPDSLIFADKSANAHIKIAPFTKKPSLCTAPDAELGPKSDIWSCGVILYTLLCGFPPFSGSNDSDTYRKISRGVFSFQGELWSRVSKQAKQLVRSMLTKDPEVRPTVKDVLTCQWVVERASHIVPDNVLSVKTLENLASFYSVYKVRQTTKKYICDTLKFEKELVELRNVIEGLDRSGDEKVSLEDLRKASDMFGFNVDLSEIASCSDDHGIVDYNEFFNVTCNWKKINMKHELENVYSTYDVNECGEVDLKDLIDEGISEDIWRNAFGQLPLAPFISIGEFKDYIMESM